MATLIDYLSIASLLSHELDAVRYTEWGLLYVLRDLPESLAYPSFVALHVPLIFFVLWLSHLDNRKTQLAFRRAFSVFVVIHALIHFRLIGSDGYTFSGWLSDGLIFGSALLASIYLYLSIRSPTQIEA